MRLSQDPHKLAKALRDYGTGQMPNLWEQMVIFKYLVLF